LAAGLDPDPPELSIGNLVDLLGDDLPAVIFRDNSVIKVHDALPTVLFRLEILVKLYKAREMAWAARFFPRVLLNEGMSHK
jgi:hypothetical protein